MKKYAFYPGCAPKGAAIESYISAKTVMDKLGIDYTEPVSFSCCGAGNVEEVKPYVALGINARNLAIAEKEERDIITICSTCYLELKKAKKQLTENERLKEEMNEILSETGLRYEGKVEVKLLHQVILDEYEEKISSMVTNKLKNLKVYPFYGCHTIRPRDIIGYDDPENPSSLERLIKLLGATPVSGARRILCCGFHASFSASEIAMKLTGLNLKEAHDMDADCVITPCPLCHLNMDANQKKALNTIKSQFIMPVLHVQQLIGLAIGLSPEEVALQKNVIPALYIV
ncbi:CoB--CoM heterodisulfide reductase iron-sulfur subunit B family protein [Desulfurobacterium indicum]|uniref:Heterodisulfide reductase subunit B n=1 Tax=Desulfurobacterium indicum TaxID=1914305 RepID=A0A1R1MJD3_9BACT|nr:CoB--CoM heterodisulfide reductase iron-sulfur subunit B family protein [Desulfurobacterium indicum]OMH39911.1 heterodisulfide reductase subunit B [Desulfurobacterium indicum]